MNSKEIDKIMHDMLNNENWYNKNSKERKLYEEMCLRRMIMSCLTYGYNIYTDNYTLKYKDILGEKRFLKVCKEQEEYFTTQCKVILNVGTDNEGVIYNSLVEQKE